MALDIDNSGLWWLPEKPDIKLSGHLIYPSGNEAVLALNGIFDEEIQFHEIILGDIDGSKVTLVNCLRFFLQKSYSGTGDSFCSKFKLIVICKGHHFLRKADLKFSKISVRYSHLRQWLGPKISGAHIKEIDPYLKGAIEKSLVVYILPEFSFEIKGFLEKEKLFYYSPYNEETDVLFYFKNKSLNELLENLDIFRNFLSICIDEKISIYNIEAREEYGNVQIILPSVLKPASKDDRSFLHPAPIDPHLFLKNAKLYLGNWYRIAKKYEPMYQLFFSDNFEQLYVTTRFLNYAQAIEAYHSRKYESRFFPDNIREIIDKFTNFSEIIRIVFPEQFSSAILTKFKYLNRKSLRMILKDLSKDFKEIFSVFIRDTDDFINRFVEIRNYYTHYDPSAKKPNYKEIIVLTENARFILLSIFLKEIGFNEGDIKSSAYLYCRKRIREIKNL